MPVATLRGLVKNPDVAAAATRTVPMLAGGQQRATLPGGKRVTLSNYGPLAETAELFDGAAGLARYARSTAAPWVKGAASATLGEQFRQKNWPTYGANPYWYAVNEQFPVVGQMLDMAGLGPVALRKTNLVKLQKQLPKIPATILKQFLEAATRTYTQTNE